MYSSKNSFLVQGLITISLKAINSTLTIQKIPRSIVYPIAEQILRSSEFFPHEPKLIDSLDNEVINSRSLSSFEKIIKIKLLSKHENRP